jgi:hypothetical protein
MTNDQHALTLVLEDNMSRADSALHGGMSGQPGRNRIAGTFEVGLQVGHDADVLIRDERRRHTLFPRSAGTTDSVRVVLNTARWQIKVNNLSNVRDIQSSTGNISGNLIEKMSKSANVSPGSSERKWKQVCDINLPSPRRPPGRFPNSLLVDLVICPRA